MLRWRQQRSRVLLSRWKSNKRGLLVETVGICSTTVTTPPPPSTPHPTPAVFKQPQPQTQEDPGWWAAGGRHVCLGGANKSLGVEKKTYKTRSLFFLAGVPSTSSRVSSTRKLIALVTQESGLVSTYQRLLATWRCVSPHVNFFLV